MGVGGFDAQPSNAGPASRSGAKGKASAVEEYVANEPSQRNWRGIVISLLVIASVIALVALAVVLVTPADPGPRIRGARINLDEIVEQVFRIRDPKFEWIDNQKLLYKDDFGGITRLELNQNGTTSQVFMNNSTFRQLDSDDYLVSSDQTYILLMFNVEKIFRHSRSFNLALYPKNEGRHSLLALNKTIKRFRLAKWGNKNNNLALVDAENSELYLIRDAKRPEEIRRISFSGRKGVIFNAVPDWLYEEEILASSEAVWFSPSDRRLLYAEFDDSDVGQISLEQFGSDDEYNDLPQYPVTRKLRYPRAGTPNPVASLKVVDIADGSKDVVQLKPPTNIATVDHYFLNAHWLNDDAITVTYTTRAQNVSVITVCRQPDFFCKEVHKEEARGGWLLSPPLEPAHFSSKLDSLVLIAQVRDSANNFYPHIIRVDVNDDNNEGNVAKEPQSLTQGKFYVTKILAWDQQNHLIYFVSTLPGFPGVRHLQVVQDSVDAATLFVPHITCLTCNEKNESDIFKDDNNENNLNKENNECGYNAITLSPDLSHFLRRCYGPNTPFIDIHTLNGTKSARIEYLETNEDLKKSLKKHSIPTIKDFEVDLDAKNSKNEPLRARVRLILPPGLREEEDFTFPLVVNVYGGPGSQAVSERWSVDFDHYLASGRDMVVAHMDVRGSDFHTPEIRDAVYNRLGHFEALDTLGVIRNLTNSLHYIDKEKIAVWGWSYGGFLALRALAEDHEHLIACTAAVAPVTQWTLYDSAYTERFMGDPRDPRHWKAYEESDLTLKASRFLGRQLLLVHGTNDDNVHLQHTMAMSRALVDNHVLFAQQIYPDESHALEGVRGHQYRGLERFLDRCLGPLPDYFSDLVTPSSGFDQLQQLLGLKEAEEKDDEYSENDGHKIANK